MREKRHLLICDCGASEHQAIFTYLDDEEIYLTYHLTKFRFSKRLWIGIKYIFGYQSRWGDFSEIVITPQATKDLVEFLNGFLKYDPKI